MKRFSDTIKEARISKGFTLRDLEEKTGISAGNLSELETEKRKPPRKKHNVYKIASALGLSRFDLIQCANYWRNPIVADLRAKLEAAEKKRDELVGRIDGYVSANEGWIKTVDDAGRKVLFQEKRAEAAEAERDEWKQKALAWEHKWDQVQGFTDKEMAKHVIEVEERAAKYVSAIAKAEDAASDCPFCGAALSCGERHGSGCVCLEIKSGDSDV